MKGSPINFKDILAQAADADVTPIGRFLFTYPAQPLLATGSGGTGTVADFAALLVRCSEFFFTLCTITGTCWDSTANAGRIDKRKPMWIPFMAEMKRNGPLNVGHEGL